MKEGRKKIATGMRMKRFVALLLTLTMAMTLAVSVSAADTIDPQTGVSQTMRAKELKSELQSAEAVLGGECRVEVQEIQRVGDYIVENRLYVLEDETVNARSGSCGAVSAHTWRRYGASSWDIKVLFAAFFYYNGQTAICRPEESNFWAVRPDNSIIGTNFNPIETYKDGSTATASCKYARDEPGSSSDTIIFGTLKVTCTKDGTLGYGNKEYPYL